MPGRHATPGTRGLARAGSRLGDALLTLTSVAGALCILLVIAALLFDISIMLFKTGSMSPTIPAGSMAIVREVPAQSVVVGDVVTVDRPGQLPVTHRVIDAERGPGEQALLTLQGDANPLPDHDPYLVDRVRIVLWSVPGVASVFVLLAQPWVMLCLALLVAAIVTWAFWPRDSQGSEADRVTTSEALQTRRTRLDQPDTDPDFVDDLLGAAPPGSTRASGPGTRP